MVHVNRRLLAAGIAILVLGTGLNFHPSANARAAGADGTVTASQSAVDYKVDLDIGPVENMMMPNQVTAATSGEVMLQAPDITRDEIIEQRFFPRNHHFEIHVQNVKTGAVADGIVPLVTVTNLATHRSYILDELMPMYDNHTGKSDLHYGTNMYLPPSTYRVTVVLDRSNRVSFDGVAVSGSWR